MGRRRHIKKIHKVTIRVAESDVLKRVAVLNTALLRTLTGTRLIDTIKADYDEGCLELLIEASNISPSITGSTVTVEVTDWA